MARYAIIDNGVVQNVIEAEPDFAASIGAIPALNAGISYTYSGGVFTPPVPALPTVSDYTAALESHYDTKARERRYDDRFTCSVRAGYVGPFQPEGIAFATWMDSCNALAYSIMDEVIAGHVEQPTIAGLLAQMPALVWP